MSHRRKAAAVATVGSLAVGALVATTAAPARTAHVAAPAKTCSFQLRIGDVLPFTGDLAAYGANLDRAVKLGVDLQNAALERGRPRRQSRASSSSPRRTGRRRRRASVEAATKLVKSEQGQRDHRRDGVGRHDPDGAVGDDPEQDRPDLSDLERAADHRRSRTTATSGARTRPTRCRARCSRRRRSTHSARARRSTSARATTRSAPRCEQLFVAQYTKLGGKVGVRRLLEPRPGELRHRGAASSSTATRRAG